jgi:hypothetical protein
MIDEAAHQREALFGGMDEKLEKWALSWRCGKKLMITVIEGFSHLVAPRMPLFLASLRDQDRRGQFREFRGCSLGERAAEFQDAACGCVTMAMAMLM